MATSKEYKMAIRIAGEVEKSFYNSTKLTKKELKDIAKAASNSANATKNTFANGMGSVGKGINKVGQIAKKTFVATAKVAAVAGAAIAGIGTASVKVGSSFEAQMKTVQSISGSTGTELDNLSVKAKEMGAKTSFSATEAGQAMEYMAMAGWKTKEMISGIDGIMNLAAASGEELAGVSDIVTDALTSFGLQAKDAAHFSDVLAQASSSSNTNVAMMGETFKYVAPTAGALKYSVEDTALAIGLMANSGIKASMAGTSLRKILAQTTDGATLAGKAFAAAGKQQGEFHIETVNSDGSMRDLKLILDDLRKGFSELTDSEKAANAESIGGKTAMSGLLAIVNASEKDYKKLYKAINNSTGAAERMSKIRLDNLKGDVTILKSGMEGLGIQIYEGLNSPLRQAAKLATTVVSDISTNLTNTNAVQNFTDSFNSNLPTAMRHLSEFKDTFLEFIDPVLKFGSWVIDNPDVIISIFAGIGSAIITFKTVQGVMGMVKAFKALTLVLSNPFVLAITAVGMAIGGAVGLATYIKQADNKMKKQNLAEHFGTMTLSIEELQKVASHIVQTKSLEKLSESFNALEEMGKIKNNIQTAVSELNKLDWRVSIGMELDETEKETYQKNIESFIDNSKNVLLQKQLSMSLSLEVLTFDTSTGAQIKDSVSKFYQKNYATMDSLGKKLSKTVNKAFEDGILDETEASKIAEIREKMNKLQEQVAGSEFEAKLDVLKIKTGGGQLDSESFQNLQAEINKEVQAATSNLDQSLELSISNAKLMFNSNSIDKTEYDRMIKEYTDTYLSKINEIELKATNFSTETIMQQYDSELKKLSPDIAKKLTEALGSTLDYVEWSGNAVGGWTYEQATQFLGLEGMEEHTRAAITELYNSLKPNMERLQEIKQDHINRGVEVPESLIEGITDVSAIGVLAGSEDALWSAFGNAAANSEEYSNTILNMRDKGTYIPKAVVDGALENQGIIQTNMNGMYNFTSTAINNAFNKGFSVKVPVSVTLDPYTITGNGLPGFAKGGIIQKPTLATFAEKCPEAAIPLNGSQRSVKLWELTGKLLGVNNGSSKLNAKKNGTYDAMSDSKLKFGSISNKRSQSVIKMRKEIATSPGKAKSLLTKLDSKSKSEEKSSKQHEPNNIVYNPIINVYGESSKQEIVAAEKISQKEFEKMLLKHEKDKKRLGFA